jgi:hypothetical protein
MVIALEGYSAQICFDRPVFQRARIVHDTLRLQLGHMEGPCAMASNWVAAVGLPRTNRPVVLDTSNDWDARKQSMLQQQRLP